MGLELTAQKGDPRRWLVLILFCFFSSSNSIQWITYGSIATVAKDFFRLSTNELNMLSTIYMIVFDVGALFACTFFERWGVRFGVIIGGSLNCLGALLKMAPGIKVRRYAPIIVAQVLNSFAQLFVLSTPPLIAAQYFEPRTRAFATSAMATSNSLGIALAMIVPPFIVTDTDPKQFYILFGAELAYTALVLMAMAAFVRPPRFQAPSKALLEELQEQQSLEGDLDSHENRRNHDDGRNDEEGEEGYMGSVHNTEPANHSLHHRHGNANEGLKNANASGFPEDDAASSTALQTSASGTKKPGAVAFSAIEDASGTYNYTANDDTQMEGGAGAGADARGADRDPAAGKGCWWRLTHNAEVLVFVHVLQTVWYLFKNRDFMLLLSAISIGLGSVWAYSTVLAQILEPFGLSAELAGIAGALNYVVGTILAYIIGLWVDRKRLYKWPLVACLAGADLCCVAILVIMLKVPPNTNTMTGLTMFFYIFAGCFQNTAGPIAFEFAMELTYPLAESVPGALLMIGANVVSPILVSISSVIIGNGDTVSRSAGVNVVIMMTVVTFVGTVCAILTRERLYRYEAEKRAKEELEREDQALLASPDADELLGNEPGVNEQANGSERDGSEAIVGKA